MKLLRFAPHIHTSFSDDCSWELGRLVRWLRRCGFHGALVCDHDRTMTDEAWQKLRRTCEQLSDARFTLVPGIEYQDPTHTVHVPVYGDAPFYGRSPDIGPLLGHARLHGAVSVFAHPARRDAWAHFDPDWCNDLAGIEVWSRKYDGIRPNAWALEAAARYRLAPFTALDFHGPRQLFPLSMTVPAAPTGNTAAAIIGSLLAGEGRPRAFGLRPERFAGGPLGSAVDGLEGLRAATAPGIRSLETRIRSLR